MKNNKNKELFELTLKEPLSDYRIPEKYFSLTPEQYLDFIEAGMKLLPNLEEKLKRKNKNIPRVKFKL